MYKQENFERNIDILAFFFFSYWLHYKVKSQVYNTLKKNQSVTKINLQKGFTVVPKSAWWQIICAFFSLPHISLSSE